MSNFAGYFSRSGPGALGGLDVDAVGRAGGAAHEAGDALHAAFLVLVQPVHAAVGLAEHAAVFDGEVLAALLGVLDDAVLVAPTTLNMCFIVVPRPMSDLRQVELVGQRRASALRGR